MSDKLVWVDIETTGLDPETHRILELGIVITDAKLSFLDCKQWVFAPSGVMLNEIDPYVFEMHTKNGLWKECFQSERMNPLGLYDEVRGFFNEHGIEKPSMYGSSVHFDRSFLRRWLPDVESLFHYRNFDVSTIKQMMKLYRPGVSAGKPEAAHRAISDCHDSIAELRCYYEALGWLNG